ncbi:MAG TPA: hypothetical protein VKQ36_00465, partial [Ktedonobacterales bacterium]|nr:hypothetical protein [Ktedonobacterales bacterium]
TRTLGEPEPVQPDYSPLLCPTCGHEARITETRRVMGQMTAAGVYEPDASYDPEATRYRAVATLACGHTLDVTVERV